MQFLKQCFTRFYLLIIHRLFYHVLESTVNTNWMEGWLYSVRIDFLPSCCYPITKLPSPWWKKLNQELTFTKHSFCSTYFTVNPFLSLTICSCMYHFWFSEPPYEEGRPHNITSISLMRNWCSQRLNNSFRSYG